MNSKIDSKIIDVTPDMAREWLKLNIDNNRKIRVTKVNQFAMDMKNGYWQLNGEPICFNESGRLVNGQHRLHAIIKADRPVTMNVIFGIADDVNIFDTGSTRGADNMLQMAGIKVSRKHTSAARAALEQIVGDIVSIGEIYRFVTENFDTVSDAVALSCKRYNNQKILERAYIAAAAWVIIVNGYDREIIERFFTIASSGFYNDESETAAIAFRNYIMSLSTSHGVSGISYRGLRQSEFDSCLRAFSDFNAGKPRKKPYNLGDFKKFDYFTGSSAEIILKQYVRNESDPGSESERKEQETPVGETTINSRRQEVVELFRKARKGADTTSKGPSEYIGYGVR